MDKFFICLLFSPGLGRWHTSLWTLWADEWVFVVLILQTKPPFMTPAIKQLVSQILGPRAELPSLWEILNLSLSSLYSISGLHTYEGFVFSFHCAQAFSPSSDNILLLVWSPASKYHFVGLTLLLSWVLLCRMLKVRWVSVCVCQGKRRVVYYLFISYICHSNQK